jgi:hypothetical protein
VMPSWISNSMIVEFKTGRSPKPAKTAASWRAGPGQQLKSAVEIWYE